MAQTHKKTNFKNHGLYKCLTGIIGFDEITEGGLPQNGITLVSGSAGSGKTLFGVNFLINGANTYDESGIFLTFEETPDEIYKDVASLNLDLKGLVSQKKIYLEHVLLEHKDIHELGFNLEGIFIRLEYWIAPDALDTFNPNN